MYNCNVSIILILNSLIIVCIFCDRVITFRNAENHSVAEQIISIFKCKSVMFILPNNCNKLICKDIDPHVDSTYLKISHDQTGLFDEDIITENEDLFFDCILMFSEKNATLMNVSNILDVNRVQWDYQTKIAVICFNDCSTNQLLSNFNSYNNFDDLINAVIIDTNDELATRVCASSKSFYKFFLSKIKDVKELKCRVNLRNESLPVSITFNPPMTDLKNHSLRLTRPEGKEIQSIEEVKGLEVEVLKTLAAFFNFYIIIGHMQNYSHLTEYEFKDEQIQKTAVGLHRYVRLSGKLQASGLIIDNREVRYTWSIFEELSCLLIDTSLFTQKNLNLYEIFHPFVYLAVIAISFIVVIVWVTIAKCLNLYHKKIGIIVLMVIVMINSGGVYRPLNCSAEKILVASFLFFNLIILNVFQGNLVNIFNKLDEFTEFEDFEAFLDSNIPVLPFRNEMGQFWMIRNDTTAHEVFAKRIELALRLTSNLNRTFIITDFEKYTAQGMAILTSISMAKSAIAGSLKRNNGSSSLLLLNIIPNTIGNMNYVAHHTLRFFPQFNKQVLNLMQSNLLSRWYDETVNDHMRQMILKSVTSKTIHSLTLVELQICFRILLYGISFSVLVFFGEMSVNRLKNLKYKTT